MTELTSLYTMTELASSGDMSLYTMTELASPGDMEFVHHD